MHGSLAREENTSIGYGGMWASSAPISSKGNSDASKSYRTLEYVRPQEERRGGQETEGTGQKRNPDKKGQDTTRERSTRKRAASGRRRIAQGNKTRKVIETTPPP